MRLSLRMKYIIRLLVWGFIGLQVSLIVLLNIPAVQRHVSAIVSDELKKVLNTDVSIGRVELSLFNRIIIEDVMLDDLQGKEMLKVDRLSARFEWQPLLEGKIVINSVQLFDFFIRMRQDAPGSIPNFQFVLDAFASKDTLKEPADIDLRINSILIRQGEISYDLASAPETPGKFNASHIGIRNLSAAISLKSLSNDTLNATIRRLSFEEQSGFALKKLGLKILADNNHLTLNDFILQLPSSTLAMDSLVVHYDSLQHLPKMTEDVHYQGRFKADLYPSDFASFVPNLKGMTKPLKFTLAFQGQGKTLELPTLSLSDDRNLKLLGKATVTDWDKPEILHLQAKLSDFTVSRPGIAYFMTHLTGSVPSILEKLVYVQCKGSANGYLHDLYVNGNLRTGVGTLEAAFLANTDENGKNTYSGSLHSDSLNVGKLLGNKALGLADFNIELEGFNYDGKYPESYLKGIISSLDFSGYRYENITLDGMYKDGGFNGKLALDDENGDIEIIGNFNTTQAVPEFNLDAKVRNLRLHDLNLSQKHKGTDLSWNLTADFTGNSIDDMNGHILLDSLVLIAPDNKDYYLETLKITAGKVNEQKEVKIESSFLNAKVTGDYSYATIPTSVLYTLQQYVPSLINAKKKAERPRNNFHFDLELSNSEALRKLFYIPIDVKMPITLSGYINDPEDEMRVFATSPRMYYNGTLYESATLLCENPTDQFDCHLRGSMLMNSGAMLNLSLDAQAKEDCLKTVLNWGNNTNVTYGGKLAALTRFQQKEENGSALQTDIEILPTTLVLNDTVWNIRPSHVAIDSGRVSIDNFRLECPNQYLHIDGRISEEETDSCRIDLKNINVEYVLNIVKFDDILFGGKATGSVHLRSLLKDPIIQTRLNVHDFAVNHGIMGEADIQGVWDADLPGIRLEANMEEKNLSKTRVTGYVSPALEELDLFIEADSTNLDLLDPYIEGIFSELNARVNGNVRLFGKFKTLDLEGQVSAKAEVKVDDLNTYLRLNNDSIYIRPGEFALQNVRVYDREGNYGTATGALRHTHLKDMNYRFDIRPNNLLLYNTNDPGYVLFYGKVYGTGSVILEGGDNAMRVDANITTGRNTRFTYVTGLAAEATSNQFITFVDKTPKRIQDQVKTEFYHYTDAQQVQEEEGPPMDMYMNLLVDITPDAHMRVIMDPVSGDDITATGSGNFQISYYNKGDFRMFGNYTVNEGRYKLSMQEVIRKDFVLQEGSTVTFTGDPNNANLDVQAAYTVNSVSLSDLSTDAFNQSTVKVNCLMNLTGNLENPVIKFDLDLPTVNDEDRELVRAATSTEEQMNTQIIYLLSIGKFYTYDYGNTPNQSSNATSSLALSTLSGQLNSLLSQAMANKNWNIGANFSTGQAGWSNVEAEAILSGRLLNNRLLINGNFGYRENVLANTNFVGDFEAIWLLNRSGDWRIRGYNQTNDRYFTKSTLTTQGIGFMYKKDFNRWGELFQWLKPKKKEPKP